VYAKNVSVAEAGIVGPPYQVYVMQIELGMTDVFYSVGCYCPRVAQLSSSWPLIEPETVSGDHLIAVTDQSM